MHPSPEVEQPSGKGDDSFSSEKDLAAEGLRSLGQTVSEKGKFVASKTANASHSKKHDDANVVIDLEDGSSDDQEESLIHHIKPSVAKRMKTRKGKSMAELMSARKAKKTADVPDISPVKKTTIMKSPINVPVLHLDNIFFYLEDGAAKWKFVIQRRVAVEREFGKNAADVKEVMDLIKAVGLLKTVNGFSQCSEGLVKEFIVNIPEDISDKNNKEFYKVYVRGRNNEGVGELEVTDNQICREITARQVKVLPVKKHLPAGKLTVKYVILHKIGAANWVPTNHISTIANTLGRFIFVVGTKVKFDYGRFMFDQIIKHATTNAVKLPITFPSMICGIILNQHPGIICSNNLPSRRKPALSVHYKLFEGSHVEDIVMTSAMKRPTSKVGAIVEIKETCKDLGERIRAKGENVEHANVSHEEEAEAHTSNERSVNNDDASGNSTSSADEEAVNSSSTEILTAMSVLGDVTLYLLGENSSVYLFGTWGEFFVFCLCEATWLLLVVDWLKGELLCSRKLHGLQGEYRLVNMVVQDLFKMSDPMLRHVHTENSV
ncbi:uncharacterized protein LOC127115239 [Lathyrus oleraceus]|uniref:uncharacterized protein LOC127115239 n=1 Tax=Pisum sativum TaxID=3888 RepID=UPI0021D222CA|nr:uncharacterized protein LOC127115239 [Pisum sativum]